MLNNNKHKMTLRERKDSPSGRLTPRKKRIAPDTPTKTPTNSGASPSKIKKVEAMIVGTPKSSRKENITPKRSTRSSARKDDLNDKRAMPAPTQTREWNLWNFSAVNI